ncbi:hypothetical protein HCN44_007926 [Aphidius gifuensis]|uniref:BOD1/SHG1 domain-containing protein n=1 Tax=Aphidius gifuensis TaxID=684658 RepID=A0A835CUB6_APHGI|nr:biorientation of chromosomes in cell division protein 1-like 1 [Aphidius gifuensis]KAF7995959.1 hypothetical protein HCN44_007926 [Aphidius gifuensis]
MDSTFKNTLIPGSPRLVDHIVGEVKSQGIFDQFRKECIADVDTKPAYQNLRTRVENSVNSFLSKQMWKPDLNKNQLREALRKQMSDSSYLDAGVERIVDQVVNPKIYSIFMPQIEDVVYKFLGLEKPNHDNNGSCEFKDLLPVDLDPVSPESDKNSLKDVSLDSADANIKKLDTGEEKLVPPGVEENEDSINHETSLNPDIDNNGHVKKSNNKFEIKAEKISASEIEPRIIISSFSTLNNSEKSEDDEDESPPFEPIESLNFNESNVSNESHLSGISELTSHRSRSPNFSNDFSRDNVDFSNYETQFSKFSSDSRLSIVTDCGSSNQASTSISNNSRDENKKEKMMLIDNFIAIRDQMSENINDNSYFDNNMPKENILKLADNVNSQGVKLNSSFNESSDDGTNNGKKNESESKEKYKSCHSSKSKSLNEKSASRETSHKTNRKKSSHSESQSDIYSKLEAIEKHKSSIDKLKDDQLQEQNERETKNLKNFYKEKIRELMEKKDLTEKEKITNDSKYININKITLGDSSTEIEKSTLKKNYRSTSKTRSSSHDSKNLKSLLKDNLKNKKTETQEKSKHNEGHLSSKNHKSWRLTESSARPDSKKSLKNEQQEKSKNPGKDSYAKKSAKDEEIRREKSDTESKDKKRKDDKKSKSKDNYCSPRNNSSNRHSSDRDGSNGSNGKNSEKSNSCLNYSSSGQAEFSNISNESSNTGNSSNETSDNNKISQMGFLQAPERKYSIDNNTLIENVSSRIIDDAQNEVSLPLKKRSLQSDKNPSVNQNTIKKLKFAEKFQEAKKREKMRKNMEKSEQERLFQSSVGNLPGKNDVITISDKERCQIIHIQSEDEAEPYPENQTNFRSNELSKKIIAVNEITQSEAVNKESNQKSRLSTVELSVRQSMNEMISGDSLQEIELTDAENSPISVLNQEEEEKKLADNYIIQIPKDISESKSILKLKVGRKSCTDDRQKLFETSSSLSKHVHNPENFSSTKKIEFSDDEDDCLYFIKDDEPLNKFTKFLKSLDHKEFDYIKNPEQILKNKIVENGFTMAPPQVKQKYSTSPLSDILLNNSNNNDASDFKISGDDEEIISPTKKKRMGRPKKQRLGFTSHTSQHSMDGENFIMPLSPESDVSATSDKTSNANTLKDEKNRLKGSNQRYASDDLYKPRPLFASSSRRSRRSNQA